MATHIIRNWTGTQDLQVVFGEPRTAAVPLVHMLAGYVGPVYLQFSMTPEQAGDLANVLMACAAEARGHVERVSQ